MHPEERYQIANTDEGKSVPDQNAILQVHRCAVGYTSFNPVLTGVHLRTAIVRIYGDCAPRYCVMECVCFCS